MSDVVCYDDEKHDERYQSNDSISVKSMYLLNKKFKNNTLCDDIQKKPLIEGACVPVYLSHIKNPSLFYVQHIADANSHNKLSTRYTLIAKKSEIPKEADIEQSK